MTTNIMCTMGWLLLGNCGSLYCSAQCRALSTQVDLFETVQPGMGSMTAVRLIYILGIYYTP